MNHHAGEEVCWDRARLTPPSSPGGGGLFDGVSGTAIDNLVAEALAPMTVLTGYSTLAARVAVSNLHKQTSKSFVEVMLSLRDTVICAAAFADCLPRLVAVAVANKDLIEGADVRSRLCF